MTLAADAATNRARLLRDVAQAIIESGYAVEPRKPYQARKAQIDLIADDIRIFCHRRSASNLMLIRDVAESCNVSRRAASVIVCKARKLARERQPRNHRAESA